MDNVFLNKMDHYLAYLAGDAKDFPDPTNQYEERLYAICKKGVSSGSGASDAEAVKYINDAINSGNVQEALDKIIDKLYYVKPVITSFNVTPAAGVYEIGTTLTDLTFTWTYNKDIKTQSFNGTALTDKTIRTATYPSLNASKSFALTASDGENSVTTKKDFAFVYATYFGVINDGEINENNILAKCAKIVRNKADHKCTFTTNKQSVVYVTPWQVKSIINQNNYEVINSFKMERITFNGCNYYVYSLPNVTVSNFAYTFKY